VGIPGATAGLQERGATLAKLLKPLGYATEPMVSPPIKLAIPLLFNLYANPREDEDKVITDS
jgi:hypothetical protein